MPSSSKTIKPQRKTKQDWLLTALEVLEVRGIDGVIVEHLAARLHTSKSGFYWHFRDRHDLLRKLLQYWEDTYTAVVIKNLSATDLDPIKTLHTVASMVRKHNLAKYDLAIRTWAKHDALAKNAVNRVNKHRIVFIRSTFAKLGFKGEELEMRTKLFVCFTTFELPMFGNVRQDRWEKQLKRRLKLLTSK